MKNLREHVTDLLRADHAHADFYNAVAGLPAEQRGVRPANFPHSAWELAEHMRIAQWDLLEYIVNPRHVSPKFPGGYWPADAAPHSEEEWTSCVQGFLTDLTRL